MRALLLMLGLASWFTPPSVLGQTVSGPDTVTVQSGGLALRALLWRPTGQGPFPAVLFNHGSYSAGAPLQPDEPATVGPAFARHGYVFLFLCRRGIGLSADQGTAEGDLMARALAVEGQAGRDRVQLQLLEDELPEVLAGLDFLRALPGVDRHRVAVAGHSFGGSLTLLAAAGDPTLRAAVAFSGSGYSWGLSPDLRDLLLDAVRRATVPVFFIHAANDYSVAPGKELAAEMQRLGKPNRLEIYPAVGRTAREGHNLVYRNVSAWERDVFVFLDQYCRRRR